MKKRIISLLLATAMLLSVTSCSKKEQTLDVENMTLEEYIEAVELPKNLTISIDPDTVTERETVKVYENLEFKAFDSETLKNLLLRNPVTEETICETQEKQYIAETDTEEEALVIYNGGEATVAEDGSFIQGGGFSYWWGPEKGVTPTILSLAPQDTPQMYQYAGGKEVNIMQGMYDSAKEELDFASREEITKQTLAFWEENGLSQVEVYDIVACDLDMLTSQYKISAVAEAEPQKKDECYVMFCRQLIDEIPVVTYKMDMLTSTSPWLWMNMNLVYTQDDIAYAICAGLIEPPKEEDGTETEILDAVSALELTKDYYGKAILKKQHDIESIGLTYIEYWSDDNKTVTLRPHWFVQVSYQEEYFSKDVNNQPVEGKLKAYDFLYFDAVTGDLCEGSTSGKTFK